MGGEAHVGGSAVRGDAGVRSEQAEDDLGLEMRMMVTLYAQVQKSRSCTFFLHLSVCFYGRANVRTRIALFLLNSLEVSKQEKRPSL